MNFRLCRCMRCHWLPFERGFDTFYFRFRWNKQWLILENMVKRPKCARLSEPTATISLQTLLLPIMATHTHGHTVCRHNRACFLPFWRCYSSQAHKTMIHIRVYTHAHFDEKMSSVPIYKYHCISVVCRPCSNGWQRKSDGDVFVSIFAKKNVCGAYDWFKITKHMSVDVADLNTLNYIHKKVFCRFGRVDMYLR